MALNWPGIQNSQSFLDSFIPPDYILDYVLQQGYLYSLTGTTGSGKTAVMLRLAAHIATGLPFGDIPVKQGRVLFLAGENPVDIRMRWAALMRSLGTEPSEMDVHFVPGTFHIQKFFENVEKWADKAGGVSLVVIDTAIAYFVGVSENDNVQQAEYAQLLRGFTTLKGKPCVVVNCHPVKRGNDTMPRGGGAFLNEVDGNLTCRKSLSEDVVTIGWAEKFRGPPFESFLVELVQSDGPFVDSQGRLLPTMIANPLSAIASTTFRKVKQAEEHELLAYCLELPTASYSELATKLGWFMGDGSFGVPYKMKVMRVMRRLAEHGYVNVTADGWDLTAKGIAQKVDILGSDEQKN